MQIKANSNTNALMDKIKYKVWDRRRENQVVLTHQFVPATLLVNYPSVVLGRELSKPIFQQND